MIWMELLALPRLQFHLDLNSRIDLRLKTTKRELSGGFVLQFPKSSH